MPRGPRQVLEERVSQISDELESLFESSLGVACRELAEQLNQAVRRLRIAPDPDELCATLEHAAQRFSTGSALFRIDGTQAVNERIAVPLYTAPALAAATGTRDPQIAAATAGEVSAALVALFEHTPEMRAYVFPLDVRERVPALIYCWGTVQVAAIELLAQVASAVWSAIPEPEPEPEPPPQLVTITLAPPVAAPEAPAAASSWDAMTAGEQEIHLRAQRFARLKAAEMRLYHAELVQTGRARRNLYEILRQPIDTAREGFRAQFFSACPSMVDYLHLELTRSLANDDTDLLGNTYPGPLV
ncbi:MAG: hypothetical protein JWP63_5728 [Candidatus Solibacter sp.]|nr:hypothetical protein [Candidatus Solibacter sp.]